MMVKKCIPSEDDQRRLSKYAFNIRKQAAKVNDWYSERVIRGHLWSHPPATYVGEKVYVRMPRKGGIKSAAKRRYVLEVKILKRNIHRHVYYVAYIFPVAGKKWEKWMPVDDITSLTLGEEKTKSSKDNKEKTRSASK